MIIKMNIYACVIFCLVAFPLQTIFGHECEDSVRRDIKQIVYAEKGDLDGPIFKIEKAFYVNGKIRKRSNVNSGWSCDPNSGRYSISHYNKEGRELWDSVFIFRGSLPNNPDSVDMESVCDKEDLVYIKECEYRESGELVWEKICWLEKDTIPIVSWRKYEYDQEGELLKETLCRHERDSFCFINEHDVILVESSSRKKTKRYHYNNGTDDAFYKQVQWRNGLFSTVEIIDDPGWKEKKVYGKDGRLKKEYLRDAKGNLWSKGTRGNSKMWEYDDSIGLYQMTQVKTKFDKYGNRISSSQKNKYYQGGRKVGPIGKIETKITYQYDTLHRWRVMITQVDKSKFGNSTPSYSVESAYRDYDDYGNLTNYIQVLSYSKSTVAIQKYKYEYNKRGDWIRKEVYKKSPMSDDVTLEKVIIRDIKYY
ncbi:MAG: hypothetical protein J6Y37_12650 [Paludibacteraceae bacterium]|nr:hypothetical protein [Paludibacteraceae bacterium]